MDSAEFEALLSDVETRLDRLKALYEQWFQGLERLEPTIARKEVERRMVLLRKEQPRNTALRFRFQSLVQRSTTLQTYWTRVGRQIEEGTYRRDLMKARQSHLSARSARKRDAANAFDIDVDLDAVEDGLDTGVEPLTTSTAPAAPSAPPEVRVAPPPPRPALSPIALPRPALSPIALPRPAAPAAPAAPRMVSPFARAAPRAPGAPPPPIAQPSPLATALPRPATSTPMGASAQNAAPAAAPVATPATATFARPGAAPRPAPVAPGPAPPAASPAPVAARPAPPTVSAPRAAESLSDQDLRRVYERYSEARRKNNEPVVAYDTLAKNLRDAAPKMQEKFGKPVDFEVVLKDGKVGLKPVPKG